MLKEIIDVDKDNKVTLSDLTTTFGRVNDHRLTDG